MPDFSDYTARLLSYTEGKDVLVMQREAPRVLAKLIDGASDEALRRRPAPGKWSVGEILAHLAEDEVTSVWRYRQMIEHSGGPLSAFDQDEWARLGYYSARSPEESLQLFRLLRESNLHMFAQLTPDEWQRFGVHAERGKMSVQDLARQMAGHDINHIEQIKRLLGK